MARTNTTEHAAPRTPEDPEQRPSLLYVEDALRGLRFGTVTLTVHDGMIVQIERTEKQRLPPTR